MLRMGNQRENLLDFGSISVVYVVYVKRRLKLDGAKILFYISDAYTWSEHSNTVVVLFSHTRQRFLGRH